MAKVVNKAKAEDQVEIEIEDGIAIPTKMSGYVQNWPLEQLNVGQSFHIKLKDGQKEGSMRHALQTLCQKKGQEYNRNLVVRKVDAKDPKGVGFRIFRDKGSFVPSATTTAAQSKAA